MELKKHIVIFSHGFGTKKDDRGLFSGLHGIAESLALENIKVILFDYNDIDEEKNIITVKPLNTQVKILDSFINKSRKKYKDVIIDIIAHSQGCLVPALLLPNGIRKVVLIAPSLNVDNQRMINLFKDHPDTNIDINGISKLGRKDGTMTIVPSLYWIDREKADPTPLYNKLSGITDLTMIIAKQDDILRNSGVSGLNNNIKIINLDGDHNFNGVNRNGLIKMVKKIIL